MPPVYDSYLKDVETSGSATVEGNLRGVYFKESYPSFSLNLKMNKGILQFAGLPQKIEKIYVFNLYLSKLVYWVGFVPAMRSTTHFILLMFVVFIFYMFLNYFWDFVMSGPDSIYLILISPIPGPIPAP